MANYNLPRGSRKGIPNKTSAALKAMVLGALKEVGGQAYLVEQAKENPHLFLALVARCLPRQPVDTDIGPLVSIVDMTDEQLYALAGVPMPEDETSPVIEGNRLPPPEEDA